MEGLAKKKEEEDGAHPKLAAALAIVCNDALECTTKSCGLLLPGHTHGCWLAAFSGGGDDDDGPATPTAAGAGTVGQVAETGFAANERSHGWSIFYMGQTKNKSRHKHERI
jgi:hypothetical protein